LKKREGKRTPIAQQKPIGKGWGGIKKGQRVQFWVEKGGGEGVGSKLGKRGKGANWKGRDACQNAGHKDIVLSGEKTPINKRAPWESKPSSRRQ